MLTSKDCNTLVITNTVEHSGRVFGVMTLEFEITKIRFKVALYMGAIL